MGDHPVVEGFSDSVEIGVMGDVHGDLGHLLQVATMFARRGVTTLLQLGDWGFVWPGENWSITLDKLDRRLGRLGSTLFFLLGNHDAYPLVESFPESADGLRWLRPHLACVPRGWRTVIGGKHQFAALGGANSIDRQYRTPGRDWWAEEQITDLDLIRLGTREADVLVGHETALGIPTLDSFLASRPRWPVDAEYANTSRAQFHRALLQTRPRLTLSGHHHRHIDETVLYTDGRGAFTCRVVVLDQNGPGISQAILDTQTLDLTFFHRNGSQPVNPHERRINE